MRKREVCKKVRELDRAGASALVIYRCLFPRDSVPDYQHILKAGTLYYQYGGADRELWQDFVRLAVEAGWKGGQ